MRGSGMRAPPCVSGPSVDDMGHLGARVEIAALLHDDARLPLAELLGIGLIGRAEQRHAGEQGEKGRETHVFLTETSNPPTF